MTGNGKRRGPLPPRLDALDLAAVLCILVGLGVFGWGLRFFWNAITPGGYSFSLVVIIAGAILFAIGVVLGLFVMRATNDK